MQGSAPLAGFYYQNCVAALKIIDCLFFKNDISHIVLENYDKGEHIDDIIIFRKSGREYYQIKWSEDSDNSYTLYNLLNSSDPGKKSLFKQLAEGYITAKKLTDPFSITLFTTKQISNQKRPSDDVTIGLNDFIKDFLAPLQSSTSKYYELSNYNANEKILEKIRQITTLEKDSFDDFLKRLKFNFNSDSNENIQIAIKAKLTHLGIEANLLATLINQVIKWSISGEKITKEVLLKSLGLDHRLEDKLSQFFKVVDDAYYVPNSDLYSKLDTALNELKGGYIFIEGLPGIGKSTALTKYKETNPDILFTYYCFIPDNTDFGKLRNKSEYFLQSLCIAIERLFDEEDLPLKYSDNFEQKLAEYIKKISALNKKAVFIVDGLDHVHRDVEFQNDSLLNNIKGILPDNVYFILSSQYEKVLSEDVKQAIKSDSRRHIIVSEFTQSEIARYLKNKGLEAENVLDEIEQTSKGIPLYLHYISELLLTVPSYDYGSILQQLPKLSSGGISAYHEFLYQKIDNDPLSKWILSLLAFRREPIDSDTVKALLEKLNITGDLVQIEQAISRFAHLLRKHDGKSYSIFHNSFREFIISKNLRDKQKFNQALASYYESNPTTDEAYRSYLTHLFEIGQFQKILEIATIEWVRAAWNNYRSVDEISENIDVAWRAATEIKSLSQFVRLCFIKAQVGQLSYNIQNSEVGFPYLFLYAGLEQQSIRGIWNGDYVSTSKLYFSSYLCDYYKLTGKLLPNRIIQQGYSKQATKLSSDDVTTVLKGESLFNPDIKSLFEKIQATEWKNHRDPNSDFLAKKKSSSENKRINQEIQLEIIQFLFEAKKFDALRIIEREFNQDKVISDHAKLALAKILMPASKNDAIILFKQIDFNLIDNIETCISYISEYLSNQEVSDIINHQSVLPEFQSDVVDKGFSYKIHISFVEFLDKLKCIWVTNPALIQQAVLKVSSLPSPARNLYDFSIFLSEAWNLIRIRSSNRHSILDFLIKAIKSLNVPSRVIKMRAHQTDTYGEFSFISRTIHNLYGQLFDLACKGLTTQELETLVDQWLQIDSGEDGYSNYYCYLEIAKIIHSNNKQELKEQKLKLIEEGERRARFTEETASLVDELAEVAKAYGYCGFQDEFERIYKQLFDVAFGIGSRKDYQAELIISPLKELHKIDPKNSLNRLQEIFEIQNDLLDAGNGRMGHICLSNLIAFSIESFPELAFRLIDFEEENIARQEALQIIMDELFLNGKEEHLPYYWALVNTVSPWERENHFFNLSISLLYTAIRLKNDKYIRIIADALKHHLLVENNETEQLKKFLNLINEEGISLEGEQLIIPPEQPRPKPLREKFKIWKNRWSTSEFVDLFNKNYEQFTAKINSELLLAWEDSINRKIRSEYRRSSYIFRQFYEKLSLPHQIAIDHGKNKLIRAYLYLRDKILEIGSIPSYLQLEEEFNRLLNVLKTIIPSNVVEDFIENEFDQKEWLESLISHLSGFTRSLLEEVISEKEVIDFCSKISILNYNNILDFISSKLVGETKSICKIKVAQRIVSFDIDQAKKLLIEAAGGENDRFIFKSYVRNELPVGQPLVNAISAVDPEFIKKFLLDCYVSQKGRYAFNTISDLDQLYAYKDIFDDQHSLKAHYDSNLAYNKALASGLPKKQRNYGFISLHEENLPSFNTYIKYIISLFNYPVISIRMLAIKSLCDLVKATPSSVELIIKLGLNDNVTKIEYTLTCLQAIAIMNPKLLTPFKKELWILFEISHFNICEQNKELILILQKHDKQFLSSKENEYLEKINKEHIIQIGIPIISNLRGRNFIYSINQSRLMQSLYENENDDTNIQDDIYYDLVVNKGYQNYLADQDHAYHRRYDINSNFDRIEINSPYVDDTQDSINKVFYSKIKRGCFDEEFISSVRYKFRLFDPSYFLNKRAKKPDYVSWVQEGITETDFINFSDLDSTISTFLNRESEYVTLYENGSQRPSEFHPSVELSTYFEIIAYAAKKSMPLKNKPNSLLPYVQTENMYFHSLFNSIPNSTNFPEKGIVPLIGISYNRFRGENDSSIAITLPDINSDLNLNCSNFHIDLQDTTGNLKTLFWQNSYSNGRRRYKPTSEGVILKIKKDLLLNYLAKKGLELRFKFIIRRSIDKYKTEKEMQWHSKSGVIKYK